MKILKIKYKQIIVLFFKAWKSALLKELNDLISRKAKIILLLRTIGKIALALLKVRLKVSLLPQILR